MTSSVPLQPVSTGLSSHTRLPFTGHGPMVVRQETVLSAPRSAEADQSAPVDPTPSESSVSRKLFPQQVQPASSDDVIGTTLDHFVIESRVGAGGMGTVFLARDQRLQRRVALKVLSPQQTADPSAVQRFQNEARSAARLDHDHVARVFFSGDDHGLHYIAYEFVEGTNLRELIRQRGRLEPAEVVSYAVQLASALCHTSACGVVHRDIKPSNIIITPQAKAKLVDLGLARKETLEESAQLTVAGTTLGTFDYISPEQAKDPRNVDVRSDIYSLGCTLYHALTGEPPFPDGTVLQRLLDHQDKPPPDPAAKNRRVSPALAAIVRKMMAGDPKHRYPSGEDLLRDLLVISRAMGLQALPADSAIMAAWSGANRGDWSQHALWLVAAAGLFLAAVLLQVFPEAANRLVGLKTTGDEVVTTVSEEALPTASGSADLIASHTREDADHGVYSPPQPSPEETFNSAPSVAIGPMATSPPRADSLANRLPPTMSLGPIFDGELPPLLTSNAPISPRDTQELVPAPFLHPAGIKPLPSEPRTPQVVAPTIPPRDSATSKTPTEVPTAASTNVADAASAVASASPFIILGTGKAYASLEAACAEVKDQAVIELDYDGRLAVAERPLRLINKRVVVQAAKGRRPVIWFAPRDAVTDAFQTRMISVTGGTLSLVNVAIELKVPETSSADLWAVFRLARPERFRLERSSVTILNPARVPAAVAEVATPDSDAFSKMGAMKEGLPLVPSEVIIEESLVRGEAAGLRIRDASAFRFVFSQTLFALDEWLLQAEPEAPGMNAALRLSVDLTNTTCLLGQGLLRSSDSEAITGRPTPIEIRAHNNIVAVGPSAALIEQHFPLTAMDAHRSLSWVGEHNYFDSIGQFWLVQAPGPLGEQRWNYQAWRDYWGPAEVSGSQNVPVVWKTPWRLKEWAKITAEDIQLDATTDDNPPRGAVDGLDAGATPSLLPAERTASPPR
ncbi:MAG TPA: serine/threonine-protein kinase [Planctomycetaceae bacterium]|nr:serine/threonine-protein kinase [Planctomycetaceae bacterium]